MDLFEGSVFTLCLHLVFYQFFHFNQEDSMFLFQCGLGDF